MEPRITVFVPTYNRARLLRESIDSILAQTYRDFRLEISDNASTDETPQVVASYDDPRIVSIRQPENLGMLGNHNWFLSRVNTEYALILPDDDIIHPTLLERAVSVLDAHPRAGTVHTGFNVIGPEGEVLRSDVNWTYGLTDDAVETADEFVVESMRWSCRICASTALMRVEAIPEGGMSQDDFPAIDFGMWLRMAADGWEFAFLSDTLGDYRIHDATHSAAYGPPNGPGYVQGVEIVSRLKQVKRRFVETRKPERAAELMRLAERARRRELVVMARNTTLPERRPLPTLKALFGATRCDLGLVLEPSAWMLAGASLLGPRMVDRLRGRRDETRQAA